MIQAVGTCTTTSALSRVPRPVCCIAGSMVRIPLPSSPTPLPIKPLYTCRCFTSILDKSVDSNEHVNISPAKTSEDGVVGLPIDFDIQSKVEGNESQIVIINLEPNCQILSQIRSYDVHDRKHNDRHYDGRRPFGWLQADAHGAKFLHQRLRLRRSTEIYRNRGSWDRLPLKNHSVERRSIRKPTSVSAGRSPVLFSYNIH